MAEYRLDIVASAEGLTKGLNDAQNSLQELGAEAIQTGKETQKAFADTGGIEKMQRSLKDQFLFLGKMEIQYQKLSKAIKAASDPKEIAALNLQIKATTESVVKFDQQLDKTETTNKSLKAQLRENKLILAEMEEQGLETTKSFFNLQVATGKLQDQINDTNERIKFFASDTKGLDGLIGVTKLVTAGFAVGQGAAALFGAENENVQKALLKVNAAMAILNGLQEIQQALQKSSAARIAIETALQKVKIFFLGAETAATEGLTVAQIQAANAAKILRVALLSTGILAVVGLLYAAAKAMGAFDEATQDATKSIEEQQRRLENFQSFLDKQTAIDITRAKRRGATDEEIRNIEQKGREKNLQAIESDIEKTKALMLKKAGDQEEFDKLKARQNDLRNQADQVAAEIAIAREENITERVLKIREDEEKANEERIKKNKESSEKAARDAKQRADRLLKISEEQAKFLLEAKKKADEGFNKLFAKTVVDNDKIIQERLSLIDSLEQIALLEKDIEFESGNKSIAETRRIAEEKLKIELDFAKERLELLESSGGSVEQIRALELAIKKGQNALDELAKGASNEKFLKAIGLGEITPDELQGIKDNLKVVGSAIKQILGDLLDEAIENNSFVINSLDKQIEVVSDNINAQRQLQEEGRANNLQAEKEHLERLQAERVTALEKQKKLQKEALAIDAALQISALVTSAANIFKATSSLGPIGIALAVASITAMFAAFALTQIRARQSINQQTLKEGGEVKGKRHKADGWGGNRFVSDTGDETYIEAGEWVTKRPMAKKYRGLLEAINNDNLKFMLKGTGVQLSEEKVEGFKQLRQSFTDNEAVRIMSLSGKGGDSTEKFRKDFEKFVKKQESKPNVTYQDGKRIEIRGSRIITTKLRE